jgi:hypothetical protein
MAQMGIGQRACDSWKASVASPFHLRNFPYSLVLLRIASARSCGQFPVAPRFLRVLGAGCCSIIFASRGVDTPQIAARTDDGLLGSNCCKQALARFDSLMSDIAIFHQLTSAFVVFGLPTIRPEPGECFCCCRRTRRPPLPALFPFFSSRVSGFHQRRAVIINMSAHWARPATF